MTQLVIPTDTADTIMAGVNGQHWLRVAVHVQADVLAPEVARRHANVWLLMHAGNLLGAEQPELILGQQLMWRFDVRLAVPRLKPLGIGVAGIIGQLHLDAITGEALVSATFVEELQDRADALVAH